MGWPSTKFNYIFRKWQFAAMDKKKVFSKIWVIKSFAYELKYKYNKKLSCHWPHLFALVKRQKRMNARKSCTFLVATSGQITNP